MTTKVKRKREASGRKAAVKRGEREEEGDGKGEELEAVLEETAQKCH